MGLSDKRVVVEAFRLDIESKRVDFQFKVWVSQIKVWVPQIKGWVSQLKVWVLNLLEWNLSPFTHWLRQSNLECDFTKDKRWIRKTLGQKKRAFADSFQLLVCTPMWIIYSILSLL